MQVVIAGACVAGVADISDDIALSHVIAHAEAVGVVVDMRVIKDHLLIVAQLVNYLAAESVAPDPDDLAVAGRQHRSFARDHNIYRAVDPATGTRCVESVVQIARTPAFDRNIRLTGLTLLGAGAEEDFVVGAEGDVGEDFVADISRLPPLRLEFPSALGFQIGYRRCGSARPSRLFRW